MLEGQQDARTFENQWTMEITRWGAGSGVVNTKPTPGGDLADINRVWNDR